MTRMRSTLIAVCALGSACWACSPSPRPTAAAPPVVASCYSVGFGEWHGPVGLLRLSSAPRVFGLTATTAARRTLGQPTTDQVGEAPTSRTFVAQLLDGPSFGELVPAVTPIWWPIRGTASFVIAIADSAHGLEIQLSASDSGLAGIAVAGSTTMVLDSTSTYTRIAARSAATARAVPCP